MRARKFYEEKVGFGKPVVTDPCWVEYALEGGTHFALHKASAEQLKASNPGQSPVKFSIVVDDLKGVFEELSAKGRQLHAPRPRKVSAST